MIRTILTADKNNILLSLPDDFLGKRIEVIAFVIEESQNEAVHALAPKTFSALQLDTRGFKFNREEALAANCSTLYSEDLQHGQIIEEKLIVKNPFL